MPLAGKGGSVQDASGTIAYVKSWTSDISQDVLDVTALGDSFRKFVPGLIGGTGTVECCYYDGSGQDATIAAVLDGSSVALSLYLSSTNYISGTAYVSGFSASDPVDDVVTATFNFQFTSTISYT